VVKDLNGRPGRLVKRTAAAVLSGLWCQILLAAGGEVTGRVQMTDFCSPSVSPAVVLLEPAPASPGESSASPASASIFAPEVSIPRSAAVEVVNLTGMQFEPRVRAVAQGSTIRFSNLDEQPHLVRVVASGATEDLRVEPGKTRDFTAGRAGALKLECGAYLHMRGFVIVSQTPWFQVCSPQGDFRLKDVPPGRYVLVAWHEMGAPYREEVVISMAQVLEHPRIQLAADLSLGTLVRKEIQSTTPVTAPVRPWNEPLDGISVLLASALNAVSQEGDVRRAKRLLEDAYWGEFEASELESAIRQNLGHARVSALTGQFRAIRRGLQAVGEQRMGPSSLLQLNRGLLLALGDAVRALNDRGVRDNSRTARSESNATQGATSGDRAPNSTGRHAPDAASALSFQALKRALHRVQFHADRNVPEDAAGSLSSVLRTTFQPLRSALLAWDPPFVWRLERQFNAVQGDLASALNGDGLVEVFDDLTDQVEQELAGLDERVGSVGPSLWTSFQTVLAEALLAALAATLVASASGQARSRARLAAFLIAAASAGSASGLTAASAVGGISPFLSLFVASLGCYAAHRLLSPEARAGLVPAGLVAALLVYQAMAGTTLVFRSMLAGAASSPAELAGLLWGLAIAVSVVCVLAGSVGWAVTRLAPRNRLTLLAVSLYTLALIQCGIGIFSLQSAGSIEITPIRWLRHQMALPGLYPSLEAVAAQLLILAAAAWSAIRLAASMRRDRGEIATGSNFLLEKQPDRTAVPNMGTG
jgi:high-affinity iron transporter